MSVSVRDSYSRVLVKLGKKRAASFYPEDFTIYLNDAIQDRCNDMYRLYEKTQQLSDDLQNLLVPLVVNIDDTVPFPFNLEYIDGSPFVTFASTLPITANVTFFPSHIVSTLNVSPPYNYRNFSENLQYNILDNILVYHGLILTNNTLDQLILNSINDGIIIGIKDSVLVRDYRYAGNTNNLPFGFKLNTIGGTLLATSNNPLYFKYNSAIKMFELISGSGYIRLDNKRILVNLPSNYWHLLGITNVIDYKNREDCETVKTTNVNVKRLTAQTRASIDSNTWLEPSFTKRNNYFKEINNVNSVYPNLEILYCNEKEENLVTLKQIELQYLKEPKKYVLSDSDLDGVDNTEALEFQDYICGEIIEQVVLLFIEKHLDPRLQTFSVVNDSNKQGRETN